MIIEINKILIFCFLFKTRDLEMKNIYTTIEETLACSKLRNSSSLGGRAFSSNRVPPNWPSARNDWAHSTFAADGDDGGDDGDGGGGGCEAGSGGGCGAGENGGADGSRSTLSACAAAAAADLHN